jgi:hypothetical protein
MAGAVPARRATGREAQTAVMNTPQRRKGAEIERPRLVEAGLWPAAGWRMSAKNESSDLPATHFVALIRQPGAQRPNQPRGSSASLRLCG